MTNLFQIMDNCGGAGPIVAFIKNGVYPLKEQLENLLKEQLRQ